MVRYFSRGKEVSWERMAEILDRREAALRGTNAWVLLGKLGLENVREVIYFLSSEDQPGDLSPSKDSGPRSRCT